MKQGQSVSRVWELTFKGDVLQWIGDILQDDASLPAGGRAVWNCHIDTTEPNAFVRDMLMPFINRYDRVIFTLEQYVFEGLSRDKVCIFAPAIGPLSAKNLRLPLAAAKQVLGELGIAPTRPLITQVSRLDRWKDPWGAIAAASRSRFAMERSVFW